MKANDWLQSATQRLQQAGIESARLDALLLCEDALQIDRAQLLAHPELELTDEQVLTLDTLIQRRTTHEPLAYIRGHAEFYGRSFLVNRYVLVPRPESEAIITSLLRLAPDAASVADIGTGSGALAITAALETQAQVAATDIDPDCLAVAQANADNLNVKIQYFPGDMLEPFLQKSCNFRPDVLLANLPYVPENYQINQAAAHEPKLALFAGNNGLDLYLRMFEQTTALPQQPELILTESLTFQHAALQQIAIEHGYVLIEAEGLIQAFRPA
jgi:release factor glutamine methyltransferase